MANEAEDPKDIVKFLLEKKARQNSALHQFTYRLKELKSESDKSGIQMTKMIEAALKAADDGLIPDKATILDVATQMREELMAHSERLLRPVVEIITQLTPQTKPRFIVTKQGLTRALQQPSITVDTVRRPPSSERLPQAQVAADTTATQPTIDNKHSGLAAQHETDTLPDTSSRSAKRRRSRSHSKSSHTSRSSRSSSRSELRRTHSSVPYDWPEINEKTPRCYTLARSVDRDETAILRVNNSNWDGFLHPDNRRPIEGKIMAVTLGATVLVGRDGCVIHKRNHYMIILPCAPGNDWQMIRCVKEKDIYYVTDAWVALDRHPKLRDVSRHMETSRKWKQIDPRFLKRSWLTK